MNSQVEEFTKRPKGYVGASRPPRELSAKLFAAAKAHNPGITGITGVTATHAIMQESGNPVFFAVRITTEESAALGWVDVSKLGR